MVDGFRFTAKTVQGGIDSANPVEVMVQCNMTGAKLSERCCLAALEGPVCPGDTSGCRRRVEACVAEAMLRL